MMATVSGRFYRAIDGERPADALAGSRWPGRYSRADQPTLYLSASLEGVEAALTRHGGQRERQLFAFDVDAADLFDLRDPSALARVRAEAGDPLADWQSIAAAGGEPASWRARDWIEATGAAGLIDPSRRGPGLWHLVLFRWNGAGSPVVRAKH